MRNVIRLSTRSVLVFLCFAVAPAAPTPRPIGHGDERDEIPLALEAACAAFEAGSISAARFWAERASALLAAIDVDNASRRTYPLGNASQLLDVLAIYSFVANGTNPALDAETEWLTAQLQAIRWLDEGHAKPDQLGERSIDYAPFTNLVRRFGDVAIDRNPFTQQIRRVGDVAIDYDPFTLEPRRIGGMTIDHDPWSGALRAIGGITLTP